MSVDPLLGLSPTGDPTRWKLHVHEGVVTGGGALQGGAALGAAVEAMAAATERPLVWATAQFISHATPGATLELAIDVAVNGHKLSQARSRLTDGDHDVMRAVAAFGARDIGLDHTWAVPPQVPRPAECPTRPEPLLKGWEARLALGRARAGLDGKPGPGRSASWHRRPGGRALITAGELAIVGDYSVLEISDAVGFACLGHSLDNTLRIAQLAETEWVLLDASVASLTRGFAAITANLWSDGGALLAVFSQTLVLRRVDADGRAIRTTKRFAGG